MFPILHFRSYEQKCPESDKLVEKSAPSPMKIVHKIEDIEPLVSTNSNQIRCG